MSAFFGGCWYISHLFSPIITCLPEQVPVHSSGLLADMHRIRFLERVMAVRAGKITFGSFVRTDGHGEIGKRMPLAPDLELLVPAERCPFHVNLILYEALLRVL